MPRDGEALGARFLFADPETKPHPVAVLQWSGFSRISERERHCHARHVAGDFVVLDYNLAILEVTANDAGDVEDLLGGDAVHVAQHAQEKDADGKSGNFHCVPKIPQTVEPSLRALCEALSDNCARVRNLPEALTASANQHNKDCAVLRSQCGAVCSRTWHS